MGNFNLTRFVRRPDHGPRHNTNQTIEPRDRGQRERWVLAATCLATFVCLIAAASWPHWLAVHGAVILSGLTVLLYFAPWIEDREAPPQHKFEQQDREAAAPPRGKEADRRRAA